MAEESMVIDSGINEEIVVIIYILFHDLLLQIVSECYVHGGLAVEYKTHTECRIEISSGADFIVLCADTCQCLYGLAIDFQR